MPPQVGYSITHFIHTTTNWLTRYINGNKSICHLHMKDKDKQLQIRDIAMRLSQSVLAYQYIYFPNIHNVIYATNVLS